MARKIGAREITVVRTPLVDRLSLEDPTPTTHQITGCAVLPRASFEEGRGWVVVEGRQVIAPYGADITADDEVVLDGETWQVDGEPGDYEDRRARGKATMFYLTRVGTR